MKQTLLSIIIAVYNEEANILKCLEAIPYGPEDPVEVIIQDGNSTDQTVEHVRSFLAKGSRPVTRIYSEPDCGIYDAWNKAVQRSQSEWICFIGADDTFLARYNLEALRSPVQSANYFTFEGIYGVNKYGKSLPKRSSIIALSLGWKIMHPGSIYHIDLLRNYPFDTRFKVSGDFEHMIRLWSMLRPSHQERQLLRVGAFGVSSTLSPDIPKELAFAFIASKPIGFASLFCAIIIYAYSSLFVFKKYFLSIMKNFVLGASRG